MDNRQPGLHADHLHLFERLIVAPVAGVFHRLPPQVVTVEGEMVGSGQAIGTIAGPQDEVTVHSPHTGFLMGVLAIDGERVRNGQPLAWARLVA